MTASWLLQDVWLVPMDGKMNGPHEAPLAEVGTAGKLVTPRNSRNYKLASSSIQVQRSVASVAFVQIGARVCASSNRDWNTKGNPTRPGFEGTVSVAV
jgi:hypothetical protein